MFQLTFKIWETFEETARERAKYLKDLFQEHANGFRPAVYLDIGAGLGYNTLVFGEGSNEILAIDLRFQKSSVLKDEGNVSVLIADSQFLPFKEGIFHMVSLFSVIEHIPNQGLALREALRALQSKGKMVIQIPNRFFPLELHSGLPLVFLIPPRVRPFILNRLARSSVIDIPSKNRLMSMIQQIAPRSRITMKKVIYPSSLIWLKLRPLYKLVHGLRVLTIIPLGYLFIVEK